MNVLVVFYSRHGTAERLALAAGLGAIQARGNIRLRRLSDLADRGTIDRDPEWTQNLERMNRDYVAPRDADPEWADVIVLATRQEPSPELDAYVASLRSLTSTARKIAGPIAAANSEPALRPLYASAACAGLMVVPCPSGSSDDLAAAREHGHRLVEMARALSQSDKSQVTSDK